MIKKIVLLCSISLATNLCLALEESLDRTSTTTVVNKMEAFEGVTFEMPVLTTRQKGIIGPIVIPITKIIDFGDRGGTQDRFVELADAKGASRLIIFRPLSLKFASPQISAIDTRGFPTGYYPISLKLADTIIETLQKIKSNCPAEVTLDSVPLKLMKIKLICAEGLTQ